MDDKQEKKAIIVGDRFHVTVVAGWSSLQRMRGYITPSEADIAACCLRRRLFGRRRNVVTESER
jgi:hypothetical protein